MSDKNINKDKEHIQPIDSELIKKSSQKKDFEKLENKIISLQEELSLSNDKMLRAYAEMENIRHRAKKDIENINRFSLKNFINSLLPVIDSLEKSLEITNNSLEKKDSIFSGLILTKKLFIDVLNKYSVKQINPINELFNPNEHEAMSISANPKIKNNTIISVLQKGYKLHNRVIRPARVIVVKN